MLFKPFYWFQFAINHLLHLLNFRDMAGVASKSSDHVIETLQFPDVRKDSALFGSMDEVTTPGPEGVLQCVLCPQQVEVAECLDTYHRHLLEMHQLVIKDVSLICDFKRYTEYWRQRFSRENYHSLCNKQESGTSVEYILDASIPDDRLVREGLQRRQLSAVLAVQQGEREDLTLSRSCLFCRESFTGNRAELFNHMAFGHSFNVGQPDNIVFANEFLDLLERTLEKLQCLYCEKIFRDKTALKDHMRKKQHRKLNPKNKAYDRFYVINYLEAGRDWQEVQAERDVAVETPDSGNEESWADWEDDFQTNLVCLFCKHNAALLTELLDHMLHTHGFDFYKVKDQQGLNFYEQVKLVNFIRRGIHQTTCVYCQRKLDTGQSLLDHLSAHAGHMESGLERAQWDQPQYLFPIYENDALLCSLEDSSDDEEDEDTTTSKPRKRHSSSNVPILAEDQPVSQDSILFQERGILQTLKSGR